MDSHKREIAMPKDKNMIGKLRSFGLDLRNDCSGLAIVEFAVSLPFFLGLGISGLETANYAATIMRINQIALHVADNAARMGTDGLLSARRVSEIDINDVFTGARHEGSALTIDGFHPYIDPGTNQTLARGNARIFLASVEPKNNPNPQNKYKMAWQKCSGPGTHYRPIYGRVGNSGDVNGVGPTGRQTTAPPNGATMFAEVHYHFKPLLDLGYSSLVAKDIVAIGAMVVRDSRDLTRIYNSENVTPSSCNFT